MKTKITIHTINFAPRSLQSEEVDHAKGFEEETNEEKETELGKTKATKGS